MLATILIMSRSIPICYLKT